MNTIDETYLECLDIAMQTQKKEITEKHDHIQQIGGEIHFLSDKILFLKRQQDRAGQQKKLSECLLGATQKSKDIYLDSISQPGK